MSSDLADTFRLVAVDLRGHGLSAKPPEGYGDSKLWADDVHSVIRALNLDHPVLCGWSYGPLVILDYIRHYGEDDIRGANFIGGVTKLGSEDAASVLTADFLGLIPGFFSTDAQESVALDFSGAHVFRERSIRRRVLSDVGVQRLGSAPCPPRAVLPLFRQ